MIELLLMVTFLNNTNIPPSHRCETDTECEAICLTDEECKALNDEWKDSLT